MNIGSIQLSSPFCQAGLAGYSDRAMRVVGASRGCAYAVTEALLDVILLQNGLGARKSIDIDDEDHPVAGQIMGSEPETMCRAALLLQDAGYDVIDLNYACPVKKIKNKARGGHMLLDVERGVSILKAVRDALPPHVPTTISLRRGFDDSAESVERFFQLVETAWEYGYSAIRVHGRSVEQKYQGRANWTFLRDLKAKYPGRTIIGSGDVFTAEDAVRMKVETGVDVVWIARGAIGNPWIFGHAAALFARQGSGVRVQGSGTKSMSGAVSAPSSLNPEPRPLNPPTIHAQRDALREHFDLAMQIHGESFAGRRMRKMGIKYSRFHPDAQQVKVDFINVHSLRDWNGVLDKWYGSDGAGVWPDPRSADEVNDGGCEPTTGA